MTAVALARFQRLPNPGAESGQVVEVQFNPTEYTLTKGNQLAEIPIPGLDQPIEYALPKQRVVPPVFELAGDQRDEVPIDDQPALTQCRSHTQILLS